MNPSDINRHIHRIRQEYGQMYHAMRWPSYDTADNAENLRNELLAGILDRPGQKGEWTFADTKLFSHKLSPGCALCGEGKWSCLFINGICNANCFYCPSEQKDNGPPVTSAVEFRTAQDFADYVQRFNIQGVGFSGGEPLLSLDKVLDYLKNVKKQAERPIHAWMYTNGLLATRDKLKALRDAGLDEIRFDLSANQYNLDALEKAVGIIPVVTVEIPAVPEDLGITKKMIHHLHDIGADHLNLHQIRCTSFNAPKLIQRGYTFIHGTGVAVLETEITALTLIKYALDNQIPLPINYCSFTYRDQFQKAAARNRNAVFMKESYEEITDTGYIRNMQLSGNPEKLKQIAERLMAETAEGGSWAMSPDKSSITLVSGLLQMDNLADMSLKITYSATALRSTASLRYPGKTIRLNPDKNVVIEKDNRHPGIYLKADQIRIFCREYLESAPRKKENFSALPEVLKHQFDDFECFTHGLSPYI